MVVLYWLNKGTVAQHFLVSVFSFTVPTETKSLFCVLEDIWKSTCISGVVDGTDAASALSETVLKSASALSLTTLSRKLYFVNKSVSSSCEQY